MTANCSRKRFPASLSGWWSKTSWRLKTRLEAAPRSLPAQAETKTRLLDRCASWRLIENPIREELHCRDGSAILRWLFAPGAAGPRDEELTELTELTETPRIDRIDRIDGRATFARMHAVLVPSEVSIEILVIALARRGAARTEAPRKKARSAGQRCNDPAIARRRLRASGTALASPPRPCRRDAGGTGTAPLLPPGRQQYRRRSPHMIASRSGRWTWASEETIRSAAASDEAGWLLVTARQRMPAALAAATPAGASSMTRHCAGAMLRRSAASRKMSGAGLPRGRRSPETNASSQRGRPRPSLMAAIFAIGAEEARLCLRPAVWATCMSSSAPGRACRLPRTPARK